MTDINRPIETWSRDELEAFLAQQDTLITQLRGKVGRYRAHIERLVKKMDRCRYTEVGELKRAVKARNKKVAYFKRKLECRK
jgi:uncharacterized coiled-coil protein SlyX